MQNMNPPVIIFSWYYNPQEIYQFPSISIDESNWSHFLLFNWYSHTSRYRSIVTFTLIASSTQGQFQLTMITTCGLSMLGLKFNFRSTTVSVIIRHFSGLGAEKESDIENLYPWPMVVGRFFCIKVIVFALKVLHPTCL